MKASPMLEEGPFLNERKEEGNRLESWSLAEEEEEENDSPFLSHQFFLVVCCSKDFRVSQGYGKN